MARAVCLRCGSQKGSPRRPCSSCRFDPSLDASDLIKSVYLSVGRYDDSDRQAEYTKELEGVGERIRRGEAPVFDAAELTRLERQRASIRAVPPSAVWRALLEFFLPALGFLVLIFGLTWLIRSCR